MSNPYGVPEVSVQEVAEKRAQEETFILLDVRELVELNYANLGEEVVVAPLSQLAQQQQEALPPSVLEDKEAEIVVFCHHGNRSAQVAAWLQQQGWTNVYNMAGGIDAYASVVDPAIGRY